MRNPPGDDMGEADSEEFGRHNHDNSGTTASDIPTDRRDVENAELNNPDVPLNASRSTTFDDADLCAWESIRVSIGVFDQLVMTLLTQGTVLVFAALGIIFSSSGDVSLPMRLFLSLGVFLGVLMLALGVSRYSNSITVAAAAAKELEVKIWGATDQPNKISHRLSEHTLAAARTLGRLYYRIWAYALLALVGGVISFFFGAEIKLGASIL